MLNLPFVRCFLSMGGILWGIALHYGPKSLFAAALVGPSTNAYVYGHVNRIGGEIDDIITDAELQKALVYSLLQTSLRCLRRGRRVVS